MTKLLLNEQPILIQPTLAKVFGLNEAIVLQQIHYWLEINKESGKNFHEGRYWTYNSNSEWCMQFPFWSDRTLQRIFKSLEDKEMIICKNFNKLKVDRTKWYSINYDKLSSPLRQVGELQHDNLSSPLRQVGELQHDKLSSPLPDTKTEIKTETKADRREGNAHTHEPSPESSDPTDPVNYRFKQIAKHYTKLTTNLGNAKDAMAIQTIAESDIDLDMIKDIMTKTRGDYEPNYEGDSIRSFNYFVNAIHKDAVKNHKEFPLDSVEYLSSKYLADKILEKNPNAGVPKTDKEFFEWCIHIDYILRIDKKPVEEFKQVLKFAINDTFWNAQILDTKRLREKYDQLYANMLIPKNSPRSRGVLTEEENERIKGYFENPTSVNYNDMDIIDMPFV